MFNDNFLGNKLYELRKKANLSQEEFAEKLNVSRQAVSKWECGDALPDTENLIKISKLYGVSLDELVGNANADQAQTSEPEQENKQQENDEDASQNERKGGIHIGDDGVHVGGENGIHISEDGVHVGGKNGIHIKESGVYVGDKDVNINVHVEVPPKRCNKKIALRLLKYPSYPILITIAYLLWGFLWNGWAVGWTLYLTVPVYYSVLECIYKRKVTRFAYPALVTFVYLFMGMQWGFWHPHWILFLTIPIFYTVASTIEKG